MRQRRTIRPADAAEVASSATAQDPGDISAIRSLVVEVPVVNDRSTGDDHRLYIRLAA